jgi:hypothetical protein
MTPPRRTLDASSLSATSDAAYASRDAPARIHAACCAGCLPLAAALPVLPHPCTWQRRRPHRHCSRRGRRRSVSALPQDRVDSRGWRGCRTQQLSPWVRYCRHRLCHGRTKPLHLLTPEPVDLRAPSFRDPVGRFGRSLRTPGTATRPAERLLLPHLQQRKRRDRYPKAGQCSCLFSG